MPLIQWIMQNLSVKKEFGAIVGGEAEKKFIYNTIISGGANIGGDAIDKIVSIRFGALAGGEALIQKISNLLSSGGVEVAGIAESKKTRYFKFILNHFPGDLVYDSCNKSGVVIGFRMASYSEAEYTVNKFGSRIVIPESLLSGSLNRLDPFFIEDKIQESEDAVDNPVGYFVNDGTLTIEEKETEKDEFCENTIRDKIIKIDYLIDNPQGYLTHKGTQFFDEENYESDFNCYQINQKINKIKDFDCLCPVISGITYLQEFDKKQNYDCGIQQKIDTIENSIKNPENLITSSGIFSFQEKIKESFCVSNIQEKINTIPSLDFNAPVYKNNKKTIEDH